jgi:hypothetical protein
LQANRTLGDYLLQALPEPDSGDRAGDRHSSSDAGFGQIEGYYLEMICADFLAGASLDNEDPSLLLQSMSRFFKFLPREQQQAFLPSLGEKAA